ncbi:MAG: glycoside hydrolase family 57 [Rhizomicrobium sp.]|jgi:hypothetical protein
MNAPLAHREPGVRAGTLDLFALFHLNLAFSSIEEERRADVIRCCYRPLLELADAHGPIGLEITGYTLEEIARIDPQWCARARALIACGKIELIGSGYAQLIGPLVPARVSEANLRIGNKVYRSLLGVQPTLALVNEQAYAAGLVGLYLDAGYCAILMDWDNPSAHHPEWPDETRYLPQRAVGSDGRDIGLLWTSTVAFQKLQRFVHGDIALDAFCSYLSGRRGTSDRALCFYSNDAEIFDFRPGRYKTEEARSETSEWQRLSDVFAWARSEPGCRLVMPSEALGLTSSTFAGQRLHLESATCPVPVKKQRKYNLARWAVTGRDDLAINAACERIYRGLVVHGADDAAWKELCYLWSSDFRTHITEKRWTAYCARLQEAERRWSIPPKPFPESATAETVSTRHLDIRTPYVSAVLDRRRGLAVDALQFAGHARPAIGGLPHGHFDDISLQADWYTGDCVFEAPGEHKVADLDWCEAHVHRDDSGDVRVAARIDTPKGPIDKHIRIHATEPRIDFDITFHWPDWGKGCLRVGHVTLLPDAFDRARLRLTTHNGGKDCETFCLNGHDVDHGAPVSFLVSSSFGFGMTEGWAELGDDKTRVRIDVDRETAPLLGLLTHRRAGGSLFCQLVLSALELDETRKPARYDRRARRVRFSIRAVAPSADY